MKQVILIFTLITSVHFTLLAQVPTGTRQRSTNDTLIKKPVPKAGKYNPKATKWPKRDSLKAIDKRQDSLKRKWSKKDSIKIRPIKN